MRQRMEPVHFGLLMLLAFCLPLSTSAISVTALLILLCWLIEGNFREKLREIGSNPLGLAILVYAGVLLIGLCWTDSFADGVAVVRKQWKIFLAPVLLTTVRWDRRWWYVAAFIAGVTATMLVVAADYFDLLQVVGLSAEQLSFHTETVQLQYVPMLALAIYVLLHQVLWGRKNGWQWWGLLLFPALLMMHLFYTRGRAGQVVFFALMALLLFQYYRRNILKAYLVIALVFPMVFIAAYRFSPVFQSRIEAALQDIQTIDDNPDTSVGVRLHYWKISWRMIKDSPWIGVGTGDFSRTYLAINNALSPNIAPTNNPHNQYVFATAQLGVLGLLSMLGLFFAHFYQAGRITDGWERIRFAFPVFFMVIMCFESYLNLVGSGFLFSLMSALLFKRPPLRQSVEVPAGSSVPLREVQPEIVLAGKGSALSLLPASKPEAGVPGA